MAAQLSDFTLIEHIGIGSFGEVFLAKWKLVCQNVAVKRIAKFKRHVTKNYVVTERGNLITLNDCPFVIQMICCFQTQAFLYFVMDYHPGSLWQNASDLFKDMTTKYTNMRFYLAELVVGLGYIHSKNMIHRDVKPENILLSATGHVVISDLGLTCVKGKKGVCYAKKGTPEVRAPEMVDGLPYTEVVDWWALGVTVFQLLYDKWPFDSREKDHLKNFNNIITNIRTLDPLSHRKSPVLKETCRSDPLREATLSLLTGLFVKNPLERLGKDGVEEVKSHPLFQASSPVNWQRVENLDTMPPFVPTGLDLCDGFFDEPMVPISFEAQHPHYVYQDFDWMSPSLKTEQPPWKEWPVSLEVGR